MRIPKIPPALQSDVLDPPAGRLALVVVGESGASRCERFRARLWCSWSARFGAWRKFSSNAARIPERFGGECARGEVPCQLDRGLPSNAHSKEVSCRWRCSKVARWHCNKVARCGELCIQIRLHHCILSLSKNIMAQGGFYIPSAAKGWGLQHVAEVP